MVPRAIFQDSFLGLGMTLKSLIIPFIERDTCFWVGAFFLLPPGTIGLSRESSVNVTVRMRESVQ